MAKPKNGWYIGKFSYKYQGQANSQRIDTKCSACFNHVRWYDIWGVLVSKKLSALLVGRGFLTRLYTYKSVLHVCPHCGTGADWYFKNTSPEQNHMYSTITDFYEKGNKSYEGESTLIRREVYSSRQL